MYAFKQGTQWILFGNQTLRLDGGDFYNVPAGMSDADKESRFNLFLVAEDDVPFGKEVASTQLVEDNGRPRLAKTLVDRVISSAMVNEERDRRTYAGFMFQGKLYDFDQAKSKPNITGAGILAFMAIVAGAQPGNYYWNGEATPFKFIAQDNTEVQMDAQTVVAFGTTASKWEMDHVFAARLLKNSDPIPLDYTADAYWPSLG